MELKEIKKSISEKFDLSEKEADSVVSSFFNSIIDIVKENDKISVPHLGVFKSIQRKAYTGRNPKTGESIEIPAKTKLHFKASRDFKEYVNHKIKNEQKIAEEKYKLKKEKEKIIPFDTDFVPDVQIEKTIETLPKQEDAMINIEDNVESNNPSPTKEPSFSMSIEKKFLLYFSFISVFFLLLFLLLFLVITKTSFLHPIIQKEVETANQQSGLTQEQIDRMIKQRMDELHLDVSQSQSRLEQKLYATQKEIEKKILSSVNKTKKQPIIRIIKYKVRKGDNLWTIAKKKSKNPYNWVGVYQTNGEKIKNPNLIYPGQIILIPIIIDRY